MTKKEKRLVGLGLWVGASWQAGAVALEEGSGPDGLLTDGELEERIKKFLRSGGPNIESYLRSVESIIHPRVVTE